MSAEWYYAKNKTRNGPVSSGALKELAQSGELLPTDLIWTDSLPEWQPASTVKGLKFAAENVSPTQPRKQSVPPPPADEPDEVEVEEDRPRRKKSRRPASSSGGGGALVWVLGCIAAVLLLFCLGGGIIGAAYFGLFGGTVAALKPVDVTKIIEVKAGMSQKECEALMGPGKVVSRQTVPAAGVMFGPANLPKKPQYEVKSVLWEDGRGGKAQLSFIDDKVLFGFK